ncbi:hypothetical protein PACTADRAFT_35205 [Pachysolen tannophilus NRRL Y-2460]|uniref:DUF2415 domain-containing protein n=1 Tax=Pachysolen tannophilus NRRL Y-2460 TaxID=669874 RepID=A0A1E4TRL4_PACTA|nr:hypothetical protein PACTADRAFT_35205 [Pachysolen tannophilus NRRL Y-2460]
MDKRPVIPGYYFDHDRNRYFKIATSGVSSSSAISQSNSNVEKKSRNKRSINNFTNSAIKKHQREEDFKKLEEKAIQEEKQVVQLSNLSFYGQQNDIRFFTSPEFLLTNHNTAFNLLVDNFYNNLLFNNLKFLWQFNYAAAPITNIFYQRETCKLYYGTERSTYRINISDLLLTETEPRFFHNGNVFFQNAGGSISKFVPINIRNQTITTYNGGFFKNKIIFQEMNKFDFFKRDEVYYNICNKVYDFKVPYQVECIAANNNIFVYSMVANRKELYITNLQGVRGKSEMKAQEEFAKFTKICFESDILALDVQDGNDIVACGTRNGRCYLLDVTSGTNGKVEVKKTCIIKFGATISHLQWIKDSDRILISGTGNKLKLFDINYLKSLYGESFKDNNHLLETECLVNYENYFNLSHISKNFELINNQRHFIIVDSVHNKFKIFDIDKPLPLNNIGELTNETFDSIKCFCWIDFSVNNNDATDVTEGKLLLVVNNGILKIFGVRI